MGSDFLDIKQVAQELKLSRQRIQQLCAQGRLGTKVGIQWVITREELDAFKAIPRPVGRPKEEGEDETDQAAG